MFPIQNSPSSSLPIPSLWVIPVHQPQASCIMHQIWTGDSFLIWYYTCFNAILPNHPTLSLYDPAIPLLAYTPRKPELKETCVPPMFIAALFIIARTRKQPRCPSADEWLRKLWYIYTMEYYTAIKKYIWISSNEVDETGAYYTEWSKPERKTPIQYSMTFFLNFILFLNFT